ncbi:SCAN domain-containing protein 3-like [Leptinotarsa decemlineata]|uniref:SCAN domain-containing protein 3-like n=1 Tax=Leptinotarsa decemlineata TaxID=7539 RepID=UPI003D30BE01
MMYCCSGNTAVCSLLFGEPVASSSKSTEYVSESITYPQSPDKPDTSTCEKPSDSENSEFSEQPPKEKKKYTQKFRNVWLEEFPSLQCVKQEPICKICDKKLPCNYNHIDRHFKSKSHKLKSNILKTTVQIRQFVDPKKAHVKNSVKAAELKLTVFLHEHNLPFLLMNHLPKLIASTCPDSSIAKQLEIGRTKATNLTKNQLVEEALTELKEHLNINKLYSLIIDETTDISTKKSMAVIIRFHDNVSIKDRFLGLIEVENGTAKCLFETVSKLLKDNNITIENMTGLGADNCSVMMGNKVGVQTKFREINPTIIVMGCICHSLHLCASAAAVKLPKSVEEFLRNIINHF